MPENLKTPGVYIVEKDAFPGSVVPVNTAVPAFIGYTEKADKKGKSVLNKPIRVNSFTEYFEIFGGAFSPKFTLKAKAPDDTDRQLVVINGEERAVHYAPNNEFLLYRSIKFFFANGGAECYIVSVGTYGNRNELKIIKEELESGLESLTKEQEPTMIVIPDALLVGNQCYDLYMQVLRHCAQMQNRFAIFDLHDGYQKRVIGDASIDIITKFRELIGNEYLSYGAAYYPWLHTNIVMEDEITYMNLDDSLNLEEICKEPEAQEFLIDCQPLEGVDSSFDNDFHKALKAVSVTYENILQSILELRNLLPAASAMAGVYTSVDNSRGVWKAPANVSITGVIKPAADITHEEQENLNVDVVSGKSINAIRTFPGIGTLVWGGRTLDGNSLDWRYINVRRTMIMLEQSIKLALRAYVFEPNDANTWVTVKSMIVNFLTEKWKQGALAGASPEDAFDVQIGLGSTMTAVDILDGKMLASVKLAIVRPAEFIVVTFEQQMQKS